MRGCHNSITFTDKIISYSIRLIDVTVLTKVSNVPTRLGPRGNKVFRLAILNVARLIFPHHSSLFTTRRRAYSVSVIAAQGLIPPAQNDHTVIAMYTQITTSLVDYRCQPVADWLPIIQQVMRKEYWCAATDKFLPLFSTGQEYK